MSKVWPPRVLPRLPERKFVPTAAINDDNSHIYENLPQQGELLHDHEYCSLRSRLPNEHVYGNAETYSSKTLNTGGGQEYDGNMLMMVDTDNRKALVGSQDSSIIAEGVQNVPLGNDAIDNTSGVMTDNCGESTTL